MVWGIFWRKDCTGIWASALALPAGRPLAGMSSSHEWTWQQESERPWRPWAALAASWRPLVVTGRHCSHTSLRPLVPGVDSRALISIEPWVCARHFSNCLCARSHFILTLPYYYLHLTFEKVETRVSNPGSLTPDLTSIPGILPLNHLQQRPTSPSMVTHSLGLLICLTNIYFHPLWAIPCRKHQSKGAHRIHLA